MSRTVFILKHITIAHVLTRIRICIRKPHILNLCLPRNALFRSDSLEKRNSINVCIYPTVRRGNSLRQVCVNVPKNSHQPQPSTTTLVCANTVCFYTLIIYELRGRAPEYVCGLLVWNVLCARECIWANWAGTRSCASFSRIRGEQWPLCQQARRVGG